MAEEVPQLFVDWSPNQALQDGAGEKRASELSAHYPRDTATRHMPLPERASTPAVENRKPHAPPGLTERELLFIAGGAAAVFLVALLVYKLKR